MPTNLNPNDEEDSLESFTKPKITVDLFLEEDPQYGTQVGNSLKEWAYERAITTGQEFSKAVYTLARRLSDRDGTALRNKVLEELKNQLYQKVDKAKADQWIVENKEDLESAFDDHYYEATLGVGIDYINAFMPYAKGLPMLTGLGFDYGMPHPVEDTFRDQDLPEPPPDAIPH